MESMLVAMVSALVSGVLAYLFGKRQGKQQIQYEQQTIVLSKLRMMFLEARELISYAAVPTKVLSPDDEHPAAREPRLRKLRHEASNAIADKVEAISRQYEEGKFWLTPRTRSVVESTLQEFTKQHHVMVRHYFKKDEEIPIDPPQGVWEWFQMDTPGHLPDLTRKFDEEVERVYKRRS